MNTNAKIIIDKLDLKPHIEGGYYKRTYQSAIDVNFDSKPRPINTAIYFLLESHDFSCWHRLKSDEIWHYYCGSNLIVHQINENGILLSTILGNLLEHPNIQPQCVIPASTWFSAEVQSTESFTLVGCTVAPGFEYDDFEMGDRANLLNKYPQHKELIIKLTKNSRTLIW
ncbi:MAG: hypothetical protein A3F17_01310 [Gammaproteobacteria bacterium RIFCSPHIGHO2_12_FULL_41_15]|nr:MAG: hypothetical protein A3F17_01310 [Gammaproteobacteria bacterium RIFCSPHIGHO2_12_FULL_41_15]